MTREEHLEWCKVRAREYLERGDLANAVASMGSDLSKHPDTAKVPAQLHVIGMMDAISGSQERVRLWIEGFQ